jgi:hypothetical protein
MSRGVFARDWKSSKRPRTDWIGRALELAAIFFLVFVICLRW